MKMDKSTEKNIGQCGQTDHTDSPLLAEETSRAIAMMKRVKKSAYVQSETPSEQQRMPSYLIPDAIILCQTGS